MFKEISCPTDAAYYGKRHRSMVFCKELSNPHSQATGNSSFFLGGTSISSSESAHVIERPTTSMSLREAAATDECQQKASQYARKLNNSAAFCIEVGQYDRAIVSLRKALKIISALHRQTDYGSAAARERSGCICCNCSIEGCISYSESIPCNLLGGTTQSQSRMESTDRSKKRRLSSSQSKPDHSLFEKHPWRKEQEMDLESTSGPAGFSLYHRALQVPPTSNLDCNAIGSTLSLLIIFNLALAHHKMALASTEEDKRIDLLQKTLKFYELADSCISTRHKNRECALSIEARHRLANAGRLEMILCNNASQVYRSLNNDTKCQEFLERLTSCLMLVVDRKLSTPQFQTSTENQQQDHGSDGHSSCDSDDEEPSNKPIDRLDGFFQTAAQLILAKQCADAA